jgi:membrane protease YdiL (CAAX protease family)
LITAIWALPLVVAYIKTKNIYVPMTAHFIANAIGNGSTVIIMAIKLMEKG